MFYLYFHVFFQLCSISTTIKKTTINLPFQFQSLQIVLLRSFLCSIHGQIRERANHQGYHTIITVVLPKKEVPIAGMQEIVCNADSEDLRNLQQIMTSNQFDTFAMYSSLEFQLEME